VKLPPPTLPVVHCVTERQAHQVWAALTERLAELGLELHPDKTKIVYCRDSKRHGTCEAVSFTFLGYTFRPRSAKGKSGNIFTAFSPAMSLEARKAKSHQVRGWRIHQRTTTSLNELAQTINPIVAAGSTTTASSAVFRCIHSSAVSTPT
jgi:RNA-directed DNA polymerase